MAIVIYLTGAICLAICLAPSLQPPRPTSDSVISWLRHCRGHMYRIYMTWRETNHPCNRSFLEATRVMTFSTKLGSHDRRKRLDKDSTTVWRSCTCGFTSRSWLKCDSGYNATLSGYNLIFICFFWFFSPKSQRLSLQTATSTKNVQRSSHRVLRILTKAFSALLRTISWQSLCVTVWTQQDRLSLYFKLAGCTTLLSLQLLSGWRGRAPIIVKFSLSWHQWVGSLSQCARVIVGERTVCHTIHPSLLLECSPSISSFQQS